MMLTSQYVDKTIYEYFQSLTKNSIIFSNDAKTFNISLDIRMKENHMFTYVSKSLQNIIVSIITQ